MIVNSVNEIIYYESNAYISIEACGGRFMRYPSFSRSNNLSIGTDGYGLPPRVKISHNSTP